MTTCDYVIGSRDITARASAFCMPAAKVDGTDFIAVLEAAGAAVARERDVCGPSAIETFVTRWHGHYIGNAQLYRSKAVLESTRAKDPFVKFRAHCAESGSLPAEKSSRIDSEIGNLFDEALADAAVALPPALEELTHDVYGAY